ncbi:9931_t:CDS:1, partial [Dentiscutata erythropus]
DLGEESNSLEDLLDKLEFEEEDLEEYEIYYLEKFKLDNDKKEIVNIDDNPAVYLTEVDSIGLRVENNSEHLNEKERTIIDTLLDINKDSFAENIAEESQTLGIG